MWEKISVIKIDIYLFMYSNRVQILHFDRGDRTIDLGIRTLQNQASGRAFHLKHRQRALIGSEFNLYGPDFSVHFQLYTLDLFAARRFWNADWNGKYFLGNYATVSLV